MKKHIYKWHRTLSLIIALPVLLWAASGFMHPIMTNVRPHVATQALSPQPIDTGKIKIPLQDALLKNHIDSFANVRIISIGNQPFYQLHLPGRPQLVYISTRNGQRLPNGDVLYARHLARQFLEGTVNSKPLPAGDDVMADCCRNAAAVAMEDGAGAAITDVTLVQQFDKEYSYINCLLPVYKVSFARADGIRIYVETGQDRFAFAMDNKRAAFETLFLLFHTLGWLDALGRFKHVIELLIMSIAFLTTLMGIYIFCISKTKKPNGNEVVKARRNHRWTSIVVALFTLMFTFSGAFHALMKIAPADTGSYSIQHSFSSKDTRPDIPRLQSVIGPSLRITNISLVYCNGSNYWQLHTQAAGMPQPAATIYVQSENYKVLPDGEQKYAQWLATTFSHHAPATITKTTLVTKFTDEYGFINKRLPVWKISYASNSNERYYIETSTGSLATRVNDKSLIEGYSFALLHKHEFMAWAGKPVKDFSTMFWAAAQIAMVTVGLILYIKTRRRNRKAPAGRHVSSSSDA